MSLRMTEIVMDCAEHGAVVDFWEAALDYQRQPVNDQYVALGPKEPALGRPPILFQKVPEPKRTKNRVHMDFRSEDMEAEVERLLGLGATFIAQRSLGRLEWTVLADPEGNEFCVS